MALKIIRLLHLLSYMLLTAQVLFYLFALSDALQLLPIEQFLEFRKAVDKVIVGRITIAYYIGLALSMVVVIMSITERDTWLIITSSIALLCLGADLIIAIKGNIPLNNLINNGGTNTDWNQVRTQWLSYINYRGFLDSLGMLSLLSGILKYN